MRIFQFFFLSGPLGNGLLDVLMTAVVNELSKEITKTLISHPVNDKSDVALYIVANAHGFKCSKTEVHSKIEQEEDPISNLPKTIFHNILSELPAN